MTTRQEMNVTTQMFPVVNREKNKEMKGSPEPDILEVFTDRCEISVSCKCFNAAASVEQALLFQRSVVQHSQVLLENQMLPEQI